MHVTMFLLFAVVFIGSQILSNLYERLLLPADIFDSSAF